MSSFFQWGLTGPHCSIFLPPSESRDTAVSPAHQWLVQQPQKCHCHLLAIDFVFWGDSYGSCDICRLGYVKAHLELHGIVLAVGSQGGPQELAATRRSDQPENISRAEKAEMGCETSMSPASFLRGFCCYGNPVFPQAHFIEESPGMEDWIQLFHKVAIIRNNQGTYGLCLSHRAFLMKLVGRFFQDPWHSVLWSTEGYIL